MFKTNAVVMGKGMQVLLVKYLYKVYRNDPTEILLSCKENTTRLDIICKGKYFLSRIILLASFLL